MSESLTNMDTEFKRACMHSTYISECIYYIPSPGNSAVNQL